ncbi:hypothetical protein KC318_g38 [Hortaea werneckii]|nr:hypothetical protein KC334_g35 [Hortaea werneckii]KAI7028409.1 hypothetical protein KC355_g38 [Hortaea werneckii]KAI7676809.1 hypothetical protein KC318_g38 [Hortaea werneckii]
MDRLSSSAVAISSWQTSCKLCGSDMPPAHTHFVTAEVSEGQIRGRCFNNSDDWHRDPIEVSSSEEVTVKAIVDD